MPPQEAIITWPPFSQYNTRLLRQKTGGACLYMPQDGHCLASFEVIPHPKKYWFFRGQKNENSPALKTGCARPLLKKKSQTRFFSSSFSAVFVGNSVTPMSTLANNKQPSSKKWKNQAKIAFFLFFRRTFWHDFVTPFSTFANIKGSLPTNSRTFVTGRSVFV